MPPGSSCETFAALKLFIDNWRWDGVPFFLRTGKRMRRKLTQFVINFKPAPHLFRHVDSGQLRPRHNQLVVNVQPDEGISLRFEGKVPGQGLRLDSALLDFDYQTAVQRGALRGLRDAAPRSHRAATSRTSRIATRSRPPGASSCRCSTTGATIRGDGLEIYASGSWGPGRADELIKPWGRWRNPETQGSRNPGARPGEARRPGTGR